METLLPDIRYGIRMFLRKPGFAAIAVLTLALGIGANTAIFSVVNAVLLKSLPYHDSYRLVLVSGADQSAGRSVISPAEAQDFASQLTTLEDFAAAQTQSINLTGGAQPERVRGAFVTDNFFDVFKILPTSGRTFARGEDQPGAERVVVVNEGFWRRRLNSDPELAGRQRSRCKSSPHASGSMRAATMLKAARRLPSPSMRSRICCLTARSWRRKGRSSSRNR